MEYTHNLPYNEINIDEVSSGEQLSTFRNGELSGGQLRESMISFGFQFRPL